MNIGDVMDDVAAAVRDVPSLAGRSYGYPPDSVVAPAAIVPFPEITFDLTYARGLDEIDGLQLVVLVPKVTDRGSRDRVAAYLSGSGDESIKAALEAYTWTACDSVRVREAKTRSYPYNGVEHWAVIFPLHIIGSGN